VLAPRLHAGLAVLLQAYDYAHELDRDVWDFAVEIGELLAAGLARADLRWLVCQDYIEQATELRVLRLGKRRFRRVGVLTFTDATCFVLTDRGAIHTRMLAPALSSNETSKSLSPRNELGNRGDKTPHWDADRRELHFGCQLVKHYSRVAPNQETILAAFQEEGWPPRIDDPLTNHGEDDPRQRLHDAIRALNRCQKKRLIRFRGDGTGCGVVWGPAATASIDRRT